jgi:hypothetical protein
MSAVTIGISVGALCLDPCTLGGLFIGPPIGYLARVLSRPKRKNDTHAAKPVIACDDSASSAATSRRNAELY